MIKHNGKTTVLYDTLLRSLVRGYHCSIWTFSPNLQGRRVGNNWYRSRDRITATEIASELVHSQLQIQLSLSHVHINFSIHCLFF